MRTLISDVISDLFDEGAIRCDAARSSHRRTPCTQVTTHMGHARGQWVPHPLPHTPRPTETTPRPLPNKLKQRLHKQGQSLHQTHWFTQTRLAGGL